jgi:hypothetical protein
MPLPVQRKRQENNSASFITNRKRTLCPASALTSSPARHATEAVN